MNGKPDFLQNSMIVCAHPDDELLWFNSILANVGTVVIVFKDYWAQPQLSEARREAIESHPHPDVRCLDIDEAGTYGWADWNNPRLSDKGIAFSHWQAPREVKRVVKRTLSKLTPLEFDAPERPVSGWYADNHALIKEALRPHLAPDMNVFTHNPWGEYGHEDHIQVHRVLEQLREEIGFRIWISNYCTERSLRLALHYFRKEPEGYIRLKTDKRYADKVADVYKKADCWTWSDDWTWFEEECFIEAPSYSAKPVPQGHLMPLNMFSIEPDAKQNWGRIATGLTIASAGIGFAISEAF